jgi:ABC-type protease/lipase transport system fused ATPase/permease subunit
METAVLRLRHVRALAFAVVPLSPIEQLGRLKTHAAGVRVRAFAAWAWLRRTIDAFATPKASPPAEQDSSRSELRRALWSCRSAFIGIAIFSGLINVLMLTGSLFMLEVYDRVLPIEGTIAENIARFDPEAPAEAVIAAAKAAGVHEMIVGLPVGYETPIGEQGTSLSAGQQQRVALARALYGSPFLVVLDEPNSNLDSEGEEALTKALLGVRARGGIVIVVAHRTSALAAVDQVLVMARGLQQAFGPKDEVLSRVLKREAQGQVPAAAPLRAVQQGGA